MQHCTLHTTHTVRQCAENSVGRLSCSSSRRSRLLLSPAGEQHVLGDLAAAGEGCHVQRAPAVPGGEAVVRAVPRQQLHQAELARQAGLLQGGLAVTVVLVDVDPLGAGEQEGAELLVVAVLDGVVEGVLEAGVVGGGVGGGGHGPLVLQGGGGCQGLQPLLVDVPEAEVGGGVRQGGGEEEGREEVRG